MREKKKKLKSKQISNFMVSWHKKDNEQFEMKFLFSICYFWYENQLEVPNECS